METTEEEQVTRAVVVSGFLFYCFELTVGSAYAFGDTDVSFTEVRKLIRVCDVDLQVLS